MKKRVFFTKIAGTLFILGVVWSISSWFSETDFPSRRWRYEYIIRQVKAAKMKVGTKMSWKAGFRGTLTPLPPPLGWVNHAGEIDAIRTPKGYIVSIITSDKGHLGLSGYVFSDAPLATSNKAEIGLSPVEMPNNFLWIIDRQINRNWWSIYDNSQ